MAISDRAKALIDTLVEEYEHMNRFIESKGLWEEYEEYSAKMKCDKAFGKG